jgi:hypothetical protein
MQNGRPGHTAQPVGLTALAGEPAIREHNSPDGARADHPGRGAIHLQLELDLHYPSPIGRLFYLNAAGAAAVAAILLLGQRVTHEPGTTPG